MSYRHDFMHPVLRLVLLAIYRKAREIRHKERMTYKQIFKLLMEDGTWPLKF